MVHLLTESCLLFFLSKLTTLQKYAEDLEDASNELMLADDEAVRFYP